MMDVISEDNLIPKDIKIGLILDQCWAKSQEQCQRSGWVRTFVGQGGEEPELIPARISPKPESSRFIFYEPAIYALQKKVIKK